MTLTEPHLSSLLHQCCPSSRGTRTRFTAEYRLLWSASCPSHWDHSLRTSTECNWSLQAQRFDPKGSYCPTYCGSFEWSLDCFHCLYCQCKALSTTCAGTVATVALPGWGLYPSGARWDWPSLGFSSRRTDDSAFLVREKRCLILPLICSTYVTLTD